jgi:hypothetical protein
VDYVRRDHSLQNDETIQVEHVSLLRRHVHECWAGGRSTCRSTRRLKKPSTGMCGNNGGGVL